MSDSNIIEPPESASVNETNGATPKSSKRDPQEIRQWLSMSDTYVPPRSPIGQDDNVKVLRSFSDDATLPDGRRQSNAESPRGLHLSNSPNSRPASNSMTKQDSGGIVSFIEPMEGTEAHEALKANKDIKLSTMGKLLNKSLSMKPKFMGGMGTVKRKQKKFDKNFKGKVIDGKHELYVLSSGMMLGIRCAIGGSSIGGASGLRPETPLTPKDFAYTQHLNFPKEGSSVPGNITPPHSLAHSFKFKSYAPRVFGCIRSSFDIDVGDFMNSVCGNYNFLEFISNSKSGQFFFYSHDGKYMIKTQSKEENKFLMRILPQYYDYIRSQPNTLLVRMLGMYRVSMYHLRRKVRFVIMNSIFDTPEKIHTIFDLKGSLLGRQATEKERAHGGVLKDMDLISERPNRFFHLGPKKEEFMKQVTSDAGFLAELNIMDYSLLIGIHDRMLRSTSYINAKTEDSGAKPLLMRQPSLTAGGFGAHSNTPFRDQTLLYKSVDAPLSPILEGVEGIKDLDLDPSDPNDVYLDVDGPEHSTAPESTRQGSGQRLSTNSDASESDIKFTQKKVSVRMSSRMSDHSDDKADAGYKPRVQTDAEHGNETSSHSVSSPGRKDSFLQRLSGIFRRTSKGGSPISPIAVPSLEASRDSRAQSSADDNDASESDDQSSESELSFVDDEDIDMGDEVPTHSHLSLVNQKDQYWAASAAKGLSNSNVSSMHVPLEKRRKPWTNRKDGGINSRIMLKDHGNEIYYVGVIDILQQYNMRKRTENFFKGFSSDRTMISAVDPRTYANRFVKFLDDNID